MHTNPYRFRTRYLCGANRFRNAFWAPFSSGVLPEGNSRATLARWLGFSAENDFALLDAIGGDKRRCRLSTPLGRAPERVGLRFARASSSGAERVRGPPG